MSSLDPFRSCTVYSVASSISFITSSNMVSSSTTSTFWDRCIGSGIIRFLPSIDSSVIFMKSVTSGNVKTSEVGIMMAVTVTRMVTLRHFRMKTTGEEYQFGKPSLHLLCLSLYYPCSGKHGNPAPRMGNGDYQRSRM